MTALEGRLDALNGDLTALAAAARERTALLRELVAERDEQRRRRVAFAKAVIARRGLGRAGGGRLN